MPVPRDPSFSKAIHCHGLCGGRTWQNQQALTCKFVQNPRQDGAIRSVSNRPSASTPTTTTTTTSRERKYAPPNTDTALAGPEQRQSPAAVAPAQPTGAAPGSASRSGGHYACHGCAGGQHQGSGIAQWRSVPLSSPLLCSALLSVSVPLLLTMANNGLGGGWVVQANVGE